MTRRTSGSQQRGTASRERRCAPADVFHQAAVEGFASQIHIVLLCQLFLHVLVLQPPKVVPFLFETFNDLAHQGALHAVRLDLRP
jgi:hypothetical protein